MLDLWYKNAIIYCVDVETFMDSDGDGIGDFRGLADRLDHIEALGATCVWLLPFYPTPNRDNGYDITDFYGVDPRLGTLGDFVAFMHAARDRGMRVIVDLVINHTSIDHPWFREARRSPTSPKRDWYVWADEKPADADEGMVFPGIQHSTWSYDKEAAAWYMHRFYAHQADLNIANPAVREEIERIVGFWLELGVSGFRIDAVPFLVEYRGVTPPPGREDPHQYLTELRGFIGWRRAEAVMLAEANIKMDEVDEHFGDGDRMHMIFNFQLNQQTFLALARGEAKPIEQVLKRTPPIPATAQWATFIRNHDELDLGRLKKGERQAVYDAFGPDPDMQVYERGLRRRLAPMLGGDVARLAMAFSLTLSLPGTPMIWYGDEIGLGEDLALPERQPVRTPMQWSDTPNAGFSTAPAEALVRPVATEGRYGPAQVSVAAQRGLEGSLLDRIERLIRIRRSCPEIGWGVATTLATGHPAVLALHYRWQGNAVVAVHNLSGKEARVRLALPDDERPLVPLIGPPGEGKAAGDGAFTLPAYGYRWFRCRGERR